jgi:glycosyltransferase involved in cell wall biosynthesis
LGGLRILAVEPWLGGSHRRTLESWQRHSAHEVEVLGLPDRHWRWRMRDGARALAAQLAGRPPPDVLWASDYLDVPSFYGFLSGDWSAVPLVLYFHENQLTYPRAPGAAPPDPERDRHFAYTHVLSCLRAARVVFNSEFHRREFGTAVTQFLRALPSGAPRASMAARLEEAAVVGPGVELVEVPLGEGPAAGAPLSIAFPHRWEHDKDPAAFLEAVLQAAERGLGRAGFALYLCGERYAELPPGVAERLARLGQHVATDGYQESFAEYAAVLGRCDVVVSTARHEFFGMAVVEAMAAGCAPLLPDRLSYPDLLGPEHASRLCREPPELVEALLAAAGDRDALRRPEARSVWRALAARHDAPGAARALDRICSGVRPARPGE